MGAGAAGGGHGGRHLQLLQHHLLIKIVQLAGADRHIAHGIQYRLVVLFDQNIAGGTDRLQIGIQPAAVEDRQIQPRQQVDLLEGRFKQIPDAQGVVSPEGLDIKVRVKRRLRRIDRLNDAVT